MEEQQSLGSLKWASDETGGLSSRHIMRMVDEGKFPQPVRLTEGSERRGGRIAFVKSEVRAWITARIAERDARSACWRARRGADPLGHARRPARERALDHWGIPARGPPHPSAALGGGSAQRADDRRPRRRVAAAQAGR